LPRNAQKRTKKKLKKRRYVRTFFCELAQMYVVFSFYFFGRPLLIIVLLVGYFVKKGKAADNPLKPQGEASGL
jgi:hypothetical protein